MTPNWDPPVHEATGCDRGPLKLKIPLMNGSTLFVERIEPSLFDWQELK